MTGKHKLEAILNGQIPDAPPHWELVFQIEKAMFGMDRDDVPEADQPSFQLDVYHRLVDEFDWAAIPGGYDLLSDGCLTQILDQLYSTGLDGYQSIDPQGQMDIKKVWENYPEWILMGNVACNILQDTVKERIKESVHYCMTHGGLGKPYIFSTSNCIYEGMPPESYKIMHGEYLRILKEAKTSGKSAKGDGK